MKEIKFVLIFIISIGVYLLARSEIIQLVEKYGVCTRNNPGDAMYGIIDCPKEYFFLEAVLEPIPIILSILAASIYVFLIVRIKKKQNEKN